MLKSIFIFIIAAFIAGFLIHLGEDFCEWLQRKFKNKRTSEGEVFIVCSEDLPCIKEKLFISDKKFFEKMKK